MSKTETAIEETDPTGPRAGEKDLCDELLSRVAAALAAATPWPWSLGEIHRRCRRHRSCRHAYLTCEIEETLEPCAGTVSSLGAGRTVVRRDLLRRPDTVPTDADANLIAAAPAWLAALLSEVARLRAELSARDSRSREAGE